MNAITPVAETTPWEEPAETETETGVAVEPEPVAEVEPVDPVATFERLVSESARRLARVRAAIAEVDKVQPGLSADDEIAARKANAAKLEELRLEEGVFAARLEAHKEGLATAKKVVLEARAVAAKEQGIAEGLAALAKIAAAREAMEAAVAEFREAAVASGQRGLRYGYLPDVGIPATAECKRIGELHTALFNAANG